MEKNEKTVDDEGATPPLARDNVYSKLPGKEIRCHFCGSYGVVVKGFPRRAYGGKVYPWQIDPVSP
jgi:hypothetical protein